MLARIAWLLKIVFGAAARFSRARPTHRHGVGASGMLRVVDHPTFPEHDFFVPGATFPVCLRHANLGVEDDAALDVRGAALRLADPGSASPLDIVMNTGEASLFRNAVVFLQFLRATRRGPAGLQWMAERYPHEMEVGVAGQRRAPSSYTSLRYHSQLIFRYEARDHRPRYCRFRMLADVEEGGLPDATDRTHPQAPERRPGETRPKDYLRQELRQRLSEGPVLYRLQMQVHDVDPDDPASVLDTSLTWPHPWQDLATIVLDRALPDEVTEALRFDISHQPPSLGILKASSIFDFNSIGWLRTQVYPHSQLRRLGPPPRLAALPAPAAIGLPVDEITRLYEALPSDLRGEVSAFLTARSRLREPVAPQVRSRRLAIGRLVHEDPGPDGVDKPLHHVDIELWDRDLGGRADQLGRGQTDADGRFELLYDPADAGPFDIPDLQLRVFDPATGPARKLIAAVDGPDNCQDAIYDFGTLRLPFWEYGPGLPRLYVPPGVEAPQDFSPGRKLPLLAALTRHLHTRVSHQRLGPGSMRRMHDDYPENLTRQLERERPGWTRSDEYLCDRLLSGFYPAPLRREDGLWRVDYSWDDYEHQANGYELPNATGRFAVREGKLTPVDLTFQFRIPGGLAPRSPLQDPVVLTPGDGERWEQAKRVFRVTHFMAGEMDGHLTESHLVVEQYAMAAFRNLRRSPLKDLLFPHLKECVVINNQGAWLVFGDTGFVPRVSGLTPRSCERRFADHAGLLDWYTWRPMRAIVRNHRYADVAALFHDVLERYVNAFFEQHLEGITAHWLEAWRMSEDAVTRSVRWRGPLDDASLTGAPSRRVIHGVPRSVRPFVSGPEPDDRDLDHLRRLCVYVIFQATLWHSWINDLQYEDGGDAFYGSLGLRNGSFGAEADERIAPLPADIADQLYLTRMLTEVKFGYIMRNEDGDIPRLLRELLGARREAFAEAGFAIDRIRSRVNI